MKQSRARYLAKQGRLSEEFRCSIRRMLKDWNKILETDAYNKLETKLKGLNISKENIKVEISTDPIAEVSIGEWGKYKYKDGKLEKFS